MEYKGFVKYRLPDNEEVFSMNGFWKEVDHLKGFSNVDFVISNYDSSGYFIFHANDEEEKAELELCYRKIDDEDFVDYDTYLNRVEGLISNIADGQYDKMIFSRRKKIDRILDAEAVFKTLNKQYTNSLNYLLGIESKGVWLGASPEVLIRSKNDRFQLHSLAGTVQRNETGVYNWTEKEQEEQQYVTDYLIECFEKSEITEVKLDGPRDFEHGRVAHIRTEIEIKATDDQINELLREVPPTPAVCGIPKERALKDVRELEGYDRRFYTGVLGVYKKNNIQLFVNLRCMELFTDNSCLYVGGGITAKSDAEKEWNETELKSQTLLDML